MATASLGSLLVDYHLREEDVNRMITDLDIDEISRTGCRKWISLPAHLQMAAIVAEDIDKLQICEERKRHKFLSKWKETKGSGATYRALIHALFKMSCREDAERVCRIAAQSLPVPPGLFSQYAITPPPPPPPIV
jgi:hypothetical protein